jgi:hypothetical protein
MAFLGAIRHVMSVFKNMVNGQATFKVLEHSAKSNDKIFHWRSPFLTQMLLLGYSHFLLSIFLLKVHPTWAAHPSTGD